MELRVGHGSDIHRLVEGRPLILGGVKIPYARGLEGHSDADVLVHALVDALLGAAGKGDIGTRFSNTDPRWKGAASLDFLKNVWTELKGEGWSLSNFDGTILAEEPKLNPHIPEMKERLAEILGVSLDRCGLKAGTMEGLGPIGRGEGIYASCVVLLTKEKI